MKTCIKLILFAIAITFDGNLIAQHTPLHVNPRWEECSFQLDSSLTQQAFGQFTSEAAVAIYFRPVIDAQPLGRGRLELSLLQWRTRINEDTEAWNNTFVHPDSTHWLIDGPVLPFPGLTLRAGITDKIDAGVYWTFRPGANYGLVGAQLQYNFLNNIDKGWASSFRAGFTSLYGPKDLNYRNFGLDVIGSKRISLCKEWLSVSPYASASCYLAHSREKSDAVNLTTENRLGVQGSIGAVLNASVLRIGAEYNLAQVGSVALKFGLSFNLYGNNKSTARHMKQPTTLQFI